MSPNSSDDEYSAPESRVELLKSGTRINCYCPHCMELLNTNEHVEFIVVNAQGEKGTLKLSPFLNVFKRESTIYLKGGEASQDLLCPHCKESLVVHPDEVRWAKHEDCPNCQVPTAKILIEALSRKVPFYICMRVNCHWHGLSDKNEELIHLDDSKEW